MNAQGASGDRSTSNEWYRCYIYAHSVSCIALGSTKAGHRRPHAIRVHDDVVGCTAAPKSRGGSPPLCKVVGRRAEADISLALECAEPGRRDLQLICRYMRQPGQVVVQVKPRSKRHVGDLASDSVTRRIVLLLL